MRLSWNEIRTRAADLPVNGLTPSTRSARPRASTTSSSRSSTSAAATWLGTRNAPSGSDNTSGFIDLFWPGVLLVEQKSAGRDLTAARERWSVQAVRAASTWRRLRSSRAGCAPWPATTSVRSAGSASPGAEMAKSRKVSAPGRPPFSTRGRFMHYVVWCDGVWARVRG